MTAILTIVGGCLGACSILLFRRASRFSGLVVGNHDIKHPRPAPEQPDQFGDWPHMPSGTTPFGAATDGDVRAPSFSSEPVHEGASNRG